MYAVLGSLWGVDMGVPLSEWGVRGGGCSMYCTYRTHVCVKTGSTIVILELEFG